MFGLGRKDKGKGKGKSPAPPSPPPFVQQPDTQQPDLYPTLSHPVEDLPTVAPVHKADELMTKLRSEYALTDPLYSYAVIVSFIDNNPETAAAQLEDIEGRFPQFHTQFRRARAEYGLGESPALAPKEAAQPRAVFRQSDHQSASDMPPGYGDAPPPPGYGGAPSYAGAAPSYMGVPPGEPQQSGSPAPGYSGHAPVPAGPAPAGVPGAGAALGYAHAPAYPDADVPSYDAAHAMRG